MVGFTFALIDGVSCLSASNRLDAPPFSALSEVHSEPNIHGGSLSGAAEVSQQVGDDGCELPVTNVRYWHLADIDADAEHVRFQG
jgi:hypothetical protein